MRERITIEKINEIIKGKGFCLSSNYIDGKTKLKWKCDTCGHIWEVAPLNIIWGRKGWCPECGKKQMSKKLRKYTYADLKRIAAERNGECLTDGDGYININASTSDKISWKCNICGNIWKAIPNSIINYGSWCQKCSAKKRGKQSRKYSLEDLKNIAAKFDGYCLSDEYKTYDSLYVWECKFGHVFCSELKNILANNWCSHCSKGISERLCRCFVEQKFDEKFPNLRPKWLKNEKGKRLELDMYCEKLKLAFEHNGTQHYKKCDYFHNTDEVLDNIKKNDKIKIELCKRYGITLIIIPYLNNLGLENLSDFIKNELIKVNYPIPEDYDSKIVNYLSARNNPDYNRYLWLKKIAKDNDYELLEKSYMGAKFKYSWRCKNGHVWSTQYKNIIGAKFKCLQCYGRIISFDDFVVLAGKANLSVLSDKYMGIIAKHKVCCKTCGNKYEFSANYMKMAIRKNFLICTNCKKQAKVNNL